MNTNNDDRLIPLLFTGLAGDRAARSRPAVRHFGTRQDTRFHDRLYTL